MSKYRAFKDSWSVNSFRKRYNKGEINFDNPIQRGIVWNKKDSSLYIHSLLYDVLIYQKPFLISRKENGWDVLDGKQRGNTLVRYVANEFKLTGLEKEPLISVDGKEYSVNGKFFGQLPEDLQMKILDFQIDIAMLENAPVEIESLFFNRSNSGKAMSSIDLARSKNKSINAVKQLAKHKMFEVMFSPVMLQKFAQDEIIVKTWIALNETDIDYSSKHYTNLMETLNITDEDSVAISELYNFILEAYKKVLIVESPWATKMMKKVFFLSYVPFLDKFDSPELFAKWALKFFGNVPKEYKKLATDGTNHKSQVKKRLKFIGENIDEFLEKQQST